MGEVSDGIINGDFDMYTGEYLGEGEGFPRAGKEKIYTPRSYRQKRNETYIWIRKLLKANNRLEKQLCNKKSVVDFLNAFYTSIGVPVVLGSSWKYHLKIREHEEEFKKYILKQDNYD